MKTRADVAKLMTQIFDECQQTREKAHDEYAHDDANALANFERIASELGITREKVWYIYAKKHWDGILAHINGHVSQREDVRGRIKDEIVYLVLLWAMVLDNIEAPEIVPGLGTMPQRQGVLECVHCRGNHNSLDCPNR